MLSNPGSRLTPTTADSSYWKEEDVKNTAFELEQLKLHGVLRSKSGQRDTWIKMHEMYDKKHKTLESERALRKVEQLMEEIAEVENKLLQLENQSAQEGNL